MLETILSQLDPNGIDTIRLAAIVFVALIGCEIMLRWGGKKND